MSNETKTSATVLRLDSVKKTYPSGESSLDVLHDINFSLVKGITCSLVGPSGSGKTTLLGLCAGLDRASEGSISLFGTALESQTEDELAKVRAAHVGFVFQSFQLLPSLTALENVMIPAELCGAPSAREDAERLLTEVGLAERVQHFPSQLSGGEQQRVALARAFINRPRILFADEPTGNLDDETGSGIQNLLFRLNREHGTTLLLATHDRELAAKTDRLLRMKAGTIVEDSVQNKC